MDEAQYLHTKEDQGDWWFGLLELSVLPNFMFTISDQYNGNEHYYTKDGSIDAEKGTHSEHYIHAFCDIHKRSPPSANRLWQDTCWLQLLRWRVPLRACKQGRDNVLQL